MSKHLPPLSPVDLVLVAIVMAGCVVMWLMQLRIRAVEERRQGPEAGPSGRDLLVAAYRKKWGDHATPEEPT